MTQLNKVGKVKVSTRTRYALRAILIIAKSARGIETSEVIASEEGISKKYLDSILGSLRKANVLKSERGILGGYSLADTPENTTVLQICEVLEKASVLSPCVEDSTYCPKSCICPGNSVWSQATEAMKKVLRTATIAKLLEEEKNC